MYLNSKLKVISGVLFFGMGTVLMSSCSGGKKEKHDDGIIDISDSLIKNMTLAPAEIRQVKSELRVSCKLVADQNKQLDVYALAGGTVKSVNVELGDYVEKDQVLAVIRSGDIADYEKQLIEAQSDYEVAKKNKQVTEDMYASKLISERDYLQAKQDFNKAEAGLAKAQELQRIYGTNSTGDYIIKAPISGFVIEKNINKDMQIRPDNSNNLFTVSQLTDVWALANVYETDISKVKEKDTVSVTTIAYPDSVYTATIDKIYDVLDPQTRVMKFRVKLNNPGYLLKPEMYGSILINYSEKESMITIPASAIVFDNSNNYVLIYKGGKNFKVQKIDLYKSIGNKAYVRSGINLGEKVVTSNQLLIYNALTNN